MKTCVKCQGLQDLSQFNYKNREKGLLQPHCKNCARAYVKSHYSRNKSYCANKARVRNDSIKRELRCQILAYLATHPYVDCRETDPVVLDFDHRDESDKFANIADMLKRRISWSRIEAEIAKCDVRCANCHRRRTAERFVWYKL